MKGQRPLYRLHEVEVWPAVYVEGRGRLTTVYQVWCLAADCQDRGCLHAYRDPAQAVGFAGSHRHRLIPAYRRLRRCERRRAA